MRRKIYPPESRLESYEKERCTDDLDAAPPACYCLPYIRRARRAKSSQKLVMAYLLIWRGIAGLAGLVGRVKSIITLSISSTEATYPIH